MSNFSSAMVYPPRHPKKYVYGDLASLELEPAISCLNVSEEKLYHTSA